MWFRLGSLGLWWLHRSFEKLLILSAWSSLLMTLWFKKFLFLFWEVVVLVVMQFLITLWTAKKNHRFFFFFAFLCSHFFRTQSFHRNYCCLVSSRWESSSVRQIQFHAHAQGTWTPPYSLFTFFFFNHLASLMYLNYFIKNKTWMGRLVCF